MFKPYNDGLQVLMDFRRSLGKVRQQRPMLEIMAVVATLFLHNRVSLAPHFEPWAIVSPFPIFPAVLTKYFTVVEATSWPDCRYPSRLTLFV